MKEIQLTQGKVALVDDSDFEAVNEFKWFAYRNGETFYAARSVKKPDGQWVRQDLHRFLMPGAPDEVDHKDGDGLNNQRENLRPATHQQNMQGFRRKRPGATSKFRGVYWNKSHGKWQAQIRVKGALIHLGLFTSETEAGRAYDVAAQEHFGEFASLNFPSSLTK